MNHPHLPTRTGKVLLIYTGGTIGMGRNPHTGALEPLDFNHLVENLPEFQHIETGVDVYQFQTPIDSSNMSPENWAKLVHIIHERYDRYDGFVILHGTDAMAYTASALSFMLENLTKPVILTGSQLPIGQLRTDGKGNLVTSIELAAAHYPDGNPKVPEVCIFFSGKLLRGNRSTKENADGFNAFDTFNYPHLCTAGVNFTFHEHHILQPDYSRPTIPHFKLDPNIIIISLFPGIQEQTVKSIINIPGLRSVVMRSYGSGNAPQQPWLVKLLTEISQCGVVVVNISQCISGMVEMARYDSGYQLKDSGVISGYESTVEAAVTKLMMLQGRYQDPDKIRQMMTQSIAGEISV